MPAHTNSFIVIPARCTSRPVWLAYFQFNLTPVRKLCWANIAGFDRLAGGGLLARASLLVSAYSVLAQ
jgi:hypothetical protein